MEGLRLPRARDDGFRIDGNAELKGEVALKGPGLPEDVVRRVACEVVLETRLEVASGASGLRDPLCCCERPQTDCWLRASRKLEDLSEPEAIEEEWGKEVI